jgi:hypothetical protein
VQRAIPLYERVLADRQRVLGDDHPATMASRHNLAWAYDEAATRGGPSLCMSRHWLATNGSWEPITPTR